MEEQELILRSDVEQPHRNPLSKNLLGGRDVKTSIVRLNMHRSDLAILNFQNIALATWSTKDCSSIKGEVESFSEFCGWVTKEADLWGSQLSNAMKNISGYLRMKLHLRQSCQKGQAMRPKPSCCQISALEGRKRHAQLTRMGH